MNDDYFEVAVRAILRDIVANAITSVEAYYKMGGIARKLDEELSGVKDELTTAHANLHKAHDMVVHANGVVDSLSIKLVKQELRKGNKS